MSGASESDDCTSMLPCKRLNMPEQRNQREKCGIRFPLLAVCFFGSVLRKLFPVVSFRLFLPTIDNGCRQNCGSESKSARNQGLKIIDEIKSGHCRNYGGYCGLAQAVVSVP